MKRLLPLLLAFVFMASWVVLAYGYFQHSIVERWQKAQELEKKGMTKDALAQYRDLAQYLGQINWLKSQFNEEYSAAQIAQLRLLYQTGSYDKVIDLADSCSKEKLSDPGAVYFWSGNALIQRGATEIAPEDAFPWFHRAMAQFQKGLEEDVGKHWNIKYNYELVRTVIEQATKNKDEKPQQILRRKEERIEKDVKKVAG
ncbi:MAG: hypothetical protein HY644_09015 [Acidobacteria bacterium]|nr:hypothetical protein [Acidobacteriota bacterium]